MSQTLTQHVGSWASVHPGPRGALALKLGVRFRPLKVCEQVQGLNGRFAPFALVPSTPGPWRRVELPWRRTEGHGSEWAVYESEAPADSDMLVHVHGEGIAFGIETNVGTLWLQKFGENLIPFAPSQAS